jgi:hypothetical protein
LQSRRIDLVRLLAAERPPAAIAASVWISIGDFVLSLGSGGGGDCSDVLNASSNAASRLRVAGKERTPNITSAWISSTEPGFCCNCGISSCSVGRIDYKNSVRKIFRRIGLDVDLVAVCDIMPVAIAPKQWRCRHAAPCRHGSG